MAIACSVPRFSPNSAGANWLTCTPIGGEAFPPRVTTTLACPGATPHGTCALIWPSETNTSGAAVPLIVTESTSPSLVDTGMELAVDSAAASPLPKMEIRDPGATTMARARLH